MSDPTMILDVQHLDSGYGRSQVLFDVSLTAPRTGVVAVLGRNGAGKTTLLKTLIGEITPSSGAIFFDGQHTADQRTERRVRRGIGYVPQDQAVFSTLTVKENLALGNIVSRDPAGIDMVLNFFPKLDQRLSQIAGTLSGGERKMLAVGRALLGKPKLLLLDEPTEGVWVGVIEEIADRLQALAKQMALVVVEQHVELALKVADYVYVIDRGQVALEGSVARVRDDPQLAALLAP